MDDKVLCPYCGAEMRMLDGEVMLCGYWWYLCDKCISTTPQGESREEAKELALRRYQPENRVLALDELKAFCKANPDAALVVELKRATPSIVKWVDVSEIAARLRLASFRGAYQKGWCCWLRKPTEEERKAVPWDAEQNRSLQVRFLRKTPKV